MAKILEINLSKEDYLAIAKKAEAEGRIENAIINLKKALRMDEKYLEASMALCDIYNLIHSVDLADKTLFEALKSSDDKKAEIKCYNQLAYNHINIRDYRTAEYYMWLCGENFVFPEAGYYPEEYEPKVEKYELYDKNSDSENFELLSKAYEALREQRINDVLIICDRVPDESEYKTKADYLVIVSLLMKEDYKAAIDNAERIIKLRGENVQILTNLATAYWLSEDKDKAYEIVDHILEKQYDSEEDIIQLIPLLIHTEMHVNVVQYCKKELEITPYTRNIMMWLAEGLYNIGQHKESLRMFTSIYNIFDDMDAEYYIRFIKEKPEYLVYSTSIPSGEKLRRLKVLQDMVKAPSKAVKEAEKDGELLKLIDWVIEEDNPGFLRAVKVLVKHFPPEICSSIARKHMLSPGVTFDKLMELLTILIEEGKLTYDFDVATQSKFKHVSLKLPDTFFVMPDNILTAYMISLTEIVEASDDPTEDAGRLTQKIDEVFKIEGDDFSPLYSSKLQIARLKNIETIVGAMIARTYVKDPDAFELEHEGDFAEKHGLDKKKFDKYYTMMFGEKYEY